MATEVNDSLDTLLKIKELLKPIEEDKKSNKNDEKVEVLKIALEELRRVFDHISNIYDQLRIKALAMIAGEVAIVTFLLSGDTNTRIKIPPDISGRIFLSTGVVALGAAFVLLIMSIKASAWHIPGDMGEIEQIDNGFDNRYDSTLKFLLFLRKDYIEGNQKCMAIVGSRNTRVNWGLYLLLFGVTILLVIKYGKG